METNVLVDAGSHIKNAYGIYINENDVGDAWQSWGLFQAGDLDKNALVGHTAIGTTEAVDHCLLNLHETYETDDDNYGMMAWINQDVTTAYPNSPGGMSCVLDYGAIAEEPFSITTEDETDKFIFVEGSAKVYTYNGADIETDIPLNTWVQVNGGEYWYVVTGYYPEGIPDPPEDPFITIWPEFSEPSVTEPAEGKTAGYRMYGISGSNRLSEGGDTSALRGVVGSVDVESVGRVQAGIGTRGGITMDDGNTGTDPEDDAWMGIGACLGTYTDIQNGKLDNWYGLGIESPVFGTHATISKEIVGVGIGRLLRLAEAGTIESECRVYGLKIKAIDPDGNFTDIEKYCIYQEGDEQNYLGGSLEVNGSVKITGTSKVRYYLGSNQSITASTWTPVEFSEMDYD